MHAQQQRQAVSVSGVDCTGTELPGSSCGVFVGSTLVVPKKDLVAE